MLFLVRYGMLIVLGLWLLAMAMASGHFLSWLNFHNVARQAAPLAIIGVGTTFIMATAGIDLSVGAMVALVSCVSAALLSAGIPTLLVLPAVLRVGAYFGTVNGFVVCLGLPPFVVSLLALVYLRGLAFVFSDGDALPVTDPLSIAIGRGQILGIHSPIILALPAALIGWFVFNHSRFGLSALAIGGREEASRVMGLRINRIKIAVYAVTGMLAGLGNIVVTARLANGSPNAGMMMELEVIASVVLGGASLFGGVASIGGTVVGALFLNFVCNGLTLMGVNPFWVLVRGDPARRRRLQHRRRQTGR